MNGSTPLRIWLEPTPAQRNQLVEDLAELRRIYGTANVTQTIIEAVRREASLVETDERRAA